MSCIKAAMSLDEMKLPTFSPVRITYSGRSASLIEEGQRSACALLPGEAKSPAPLTLIKKMQRLQPDNGEA